MQDARYKDQGHRGAKKQTIVKGNAMIQEFKKGEIVIYKSIDGPKIDVHLEENSVWLTQKQMSALFDTERSVITKHLRNILKTKELEGKAVCAIFAHTAADGKTYQTNYYNLDMIISVGYRVNSKRGTQFRIWATNVLRRHLVDGYTINEKRLRAQQDKIRELQDTVQLLGNISLLECVSDEAKGIVQIISEYSRALNILDDFDHQRLAAPKGTKKSKYKLTYKDARNIIEQMKIRFKDSALVGQEKDKSFQGSIGAIYQTFDGKDVYPTVEEKAAHLHQLFHFQINDGTATARRRHRKRIYNTLRTPTTQPTKVALDLGMEKRRATAL